MRYVPSREASRILGVHPQTLRVWAREGRTSYIRTEGNQRRYDVDSYIGNAKPTVTLCYCRVSSKKQSSDLERQVAFRRERYPDAEVVTTSLRASTSGARDYSPYWSEYTQEISSELWSPT